MEFIEDKYLDREHPDPLVEKTAIWIMLFAEKAVGDAGNPYFLSRAIDDRDWLRRKFAAIARREIEAYEWRKGRQRWWRRAARWWRRWRGG